MTEGLGDRLLKALTKSETGLLLEAVFGWLSKRRETAAFLEQLDEDLARTISSQFEVDSLEPETWSPNKAKETWGRYMTELHGILAELGDEEGELVYQEYHWEPPDFDSDLLAERLDEIAVRMRPLLKIVHRNKWEKSSFFDRILEEIASGILSYPEWMGAEYETLLLGPEFTYCLIEWQYLNTENSEAFIRQLREVEKYQELIELEISSCLDFIAGLPEEEQKKIYDYLSSVKDHPDWHALLDDYQSAWFMLKHQLSSRFDQARYLETCRLKYEEDWTYAPPLIEDLIKQNRLDEADRLLERALAVFIREGKSKYWQPEKSLLVKMGFYRFSEDRDLLQSMLNTWIQVAHWLGRPDRVEALELQLAACQHLSDWDKAAAIIRRLNRKELAGLISQWQGEAAKSTMSYGWTDEVKPGQSWIAWLIEAGLDEESGSARFQEKMTGWLELLASKSKKLLEAGSTFLLLSLDLIQVTGREKEYPWLTELLEKELDLNPAAVGSRHSWLKRLGGDSLMSPVMTCWERQADCLAPDPGQVKNARYERHALWLASVREVNPQGYLRLLNDWKTRHKRRRNLWAAVRGLGLID